MTETLAQINEKLKLVDNKNDNYLSKLKNDPRKGVQKALQQKLKALDHRDQLIHEHESRLEYEKSIWSDGYQLIAGIDEVGRGPLAGPVVAAAVILGPDTDHLLGVNDSKQVSAKRRLEMAESIKEQAFAYAIEVIDVDTIDRVNIYEATKLAMLAALKQLDPKPDYLLIDAMTLETSLKQKSITKGDQRSLSIAAASILAKVHRDQLMVDYAQQYPEFEFERNMGYGTQGHLAALSQYGYTPIHRRSFAPVKSMTQIYRKSLRR